MNWGFNQANGNENEKMSAVRASVEGLFADIINYFKFLDFKRI